jgi:hypothetical protein
LGVAFRAKPAVAAASRHRVEHGDLTALLFAQGYRKAEFAQGDTKKPPAALTSGRLRMVSSGLSRGRRDPQRHEALALLTLDEEQRRNAVLTAQALQAVLQLLRRADALLLALRRSRRRAQLALGAWGVRRHFRHHHAALLGAQAEALAQLRRDAGYAQA